MSSLVQSAEAAAPASLGTAGSLGAWRPQHVYFLASLPSAISEVSQANVCRSVGTGIATSCASPTASVPGVVPSVLS